MRLLPLFSKPRNDEENSRIPKINSRILKFIEIASVALLPRNDAWNFRIPKTKNTPAPPKTLGILKFQSQIKNFALIFHLGFFAYFLLF